ncbi:mesoderm induction early response protein 2 [Ornithorhynchus anatinus]|uniref:mesoderm induction early response protein 2 n=1 Tax=Ornithorhynchus anatinus TaxID=9258 RepID=UPI0010A880D9|nr:mesoderm induction early response protein 2 [Ornithorhynchus anatinus]XP_028907903.1 mesoderm induction early response protein 2 [Ornithorhynchus anatinus]
MGSAESFNLAKNLSWNYGIPEEQKKVADDSLSREQSLQELEQIVKDLLSGEEEVKAQSSINDPIPSVTLHDALDLVCGPTGSNFPADEDKKPCSNSFDWEEDLLPSSESKKEIMIGLQYQAVVPPLLPNKQSSKACVNKDQLLWDPSALPECEVEEFLYQAEKQRWEKMGDLGLPVGAVVKDNEQALYELVKCNFNMEEALRRLQFNTKVIQDQLCTWSEEECQNFEHGFRVYGKNFYLIHANKVRTRSVGECVKYYYEWKKSERYELFTQQTRYGRKKYIQSGAISPQPGLPERPSGPEL